MESAAVNILKRAVEMDEKRRFTEALVGYQEGIQLLIDCMKGITDSEKKQHYRNKVESYMSRGESLKRHIEEQKRQGRYHEQISIENDTTGHGYQSVFGRFLDPDVTSVLIEDPYIRIFHQCQNLLRLSELLVRSCPSLKAIHLVTVEEANSEQAKSLGQLIEQLARRRVTLTVSFQPALHDRQIKLSNGWIIKIGRGLDYFKPPDSKFALGYFDLDLRPCHKTTVDVFHEQDVRATSS